MPTQRKAGCILATADNKLLVVHNIASDFWGFPKGSVKKKEKCVKAALRELYEETNQILDEKLITKSLYSNRCRLYFARGKYEMDCKVDGKEIDQYQWISLLELKQLRTSKLTQKFFQRIELLLSKEFNC
jgi:8-oxo-dGTP pyrophosphatase MutT (NUDIX family)